MSFSRRAGDGGKRMGCADMEYLGPLEIESGHYPEGAAVAEMAGRDSVAAAVAYLEREKTDLIPTFVRTGTEYGGEGADEENLRLLSSLAERRGARVHGPVGLVDHRWWWATVGRPNSVLSRLFGPWHICVGCHMYLHAMRIAFCLRTGARKVISGERMLHGGRAKINQSPEAVKAYARVAGEFDVEMLFPLYRVDDEGEIGRLLGVGWGEGERQWACVLSGNYLDERGSPPPETGALDAYLDGYLVPVTVRILGCLARGQEPDYLSVAMGVLSTLGGERG